MGALGRNNGKAKRAIMNTSQAIFFAAVFAAWLAPPAKSADANSAADANKPAREMRLDEFLSRFRGLAADYKEANEPAKKEELLGKIRGFWGHSTYLPFIHAESVCPGAGVFGTPPAGGIGRPWSR